MVFEEYLINQGVITADEALAALDKQKALRKPFGQIALRTRKLRVKDVVKILNTQVDQSEKMFGEIAVELGLLSPTDVKDILAAQKTTCPAIEDILVEMGVVDRGTIKRETENFVTKATGDWSQLVKKVLDSGYDKFGNKLTP